MKAANAAISWLDIRATWSRRSANVATLALFVKGDGSTETEALHVSPCIADALLRRDNRLLLARMKLAMHRAQIVDRHTRVELHEENRQHEHHRNSRPIS